MYKSPSQPLRDIQNTAARETTNVLVTNTRVLAASEIVKCGEGLKSVCLEQMGGILQCVLIGLNFRDNPL